MVRSEEVISYIYNNLRSGYSITDIEKELIGEGMSKAQVEQYIKYVMETYYKQDKTMASNAKHHSPHMGYFIGIVGILLLVIIISIMSLTIKTEEVVEPVDEGQEYIVDDPVDEVVVNTTPEVVVNETEENVTDTVVVNDTIENTTVVNDTVDDTLPSIVISGDFSSYQKVNGQDIFNIDEPHTVQFGNKSYSVELEGINLDGNIFVIEVDGDDETLNVGKYEKANRLPVFAYYSLVEEPYAYVKLRFPEEDDYFLISDVASLYAFEGQQYSMEIVDEYELESSITLSIDGTEREIIQGEFAVIGSLYVNIVELTFDDNAEAFVKLDLSNISGVDGEVDLSFDKASSAKQFEPYDATFEISGININNSKVNYSVNLGENYSVTNLPLAKGDSFIINDFNYTIDTLDAKYGENWTVDVTLKYS